MDHKIIPAFMKLTLRACLALEHERGIIPLFDWTENILEEFLVSYLVGEWRTSQVTTFLKGN